MWSDTMRLRHWSPSEGYASGDSLLSLLNTGWEISAASRVQGKGPAPMFNVTLVRADETLEVLVLDGPVARSIVPRHIPGLQQIV